MAAAPETAEATKTATAGKTASIALASVGITRVSLKGKPLNLERFEARASMYVSFANEKECYFLQNTFVALISSFTRRYI